MIACFETETRQKQEENRENNFSIYRMPFIPGRHDLTPTFGPQTTTTHYAETTALPDDAFTKYWVDLK